MVWRKLIELQRCPTDRGVFIAVDDKELAVFRTTGPCGLVVIDNACPHASGNLSAGELRDGVVTCPIHDWPFDLQTGVCTLSDQARVRRYPAEIRDGSIYADLRDQHPL